ncbi:MAG: hypothetical protein DHS80DRAFT_29269, partial [Piptocephalis tieghemiana]
DGPSSAIVHLATSSSTFLQQSDALIQKHIQEGRAKDDRIRALEEQLAALTSSLGDRQEGTEESVEVEGESKELTIKALQSQVAWSKQRLAELEDQLATTKEELQGVHAHVERDLSSRYPMAHFQGSQQQTEMNQAIEEQKEMIIELEDERRASRSLVADLKNKIRKLEMAQFELAEADSLGPGSQRAQALKSPPGSRSRSRDVAQSERKVREVEGLLEKERKARAEEQHQSTERIASLEAELTITKAELSVAKLMSGEK